jgi:N-acyl-D-amino-acid deacylase
MQRRNFLCRFTSLCATHVAAVQLTPSIAFSAANPQEASVNETGDVDPRFGSFDQLMRSMIQEHQVPGAALAVSRHGKILYQRAFGYADRDKQQLVQPDSLFRIASVSKPLTAVAILKLYEQSKVDLDEDVLPILQDALDEKLSPSDSRWNEITVRKCLQHTGGWNRDKSFDPIAQPRRIAEYLRKKTPVSQLDIVRFMIKQPLDFEPGTASAYSNFGYVVLGRIIEQRSGINYEDYVRQSVLAPTGAERMKLGKARKMDCAPGEVCYYDRESRKAKSLYEPTETEVDLPYGAENFEAFEAHGGWIASAPDLLRWTHGLLPNSSTPLLKPETIEHIKQRPEGMPGLEKDGSPRKAYQGLGWMVRPIEQTAKRKDQIADAPLADASSSQALQANLWHGGFIAGTEALLVCRWDHVHWAVLFNTQSSPSKKSLAQIIDPLLHRAAAEAGLNEAR